MTLSGEPLRWSGCAPEFTCDVARHLPLVRESRMTDLSTGEYDMSESNRPDRNVADALLSMPSPAFHDFVRKAVRDRQLRSVVQTLNAQVLQKSDPGSEPARRALKRLGFTD